MSSTILQIVLILYTKHIHSRVLGKELCPHNAYDLKTFEGFPPAVEEKIKTEAFLKAATEIVTIIGTFGKLLTPVVNDMNGANALLRLKRRLQLICTFPENTFNDPQALKLQLQNAYERTLKPYHGFLVQCTIKIIYNWVRTRSQLIGQGEAHVENLQVLEDYLPAMRSHLNHIDALLKKYNLDEEAMLAMEYGAYHGLFRLQSLGR
ncbi:PREDICTED: uncharacterized protein LOC108371714 [Rhagoletis zephyria]|uniref:uncharacterized protein LOC108371714 n=1 Tax=Rhagoletis zephyria TaxID=28612 RepID=UPI0008117259|nr:PREDICTED: uncharacterized protein LOC108371714 [Rhagoletis zephyria]